ncbi:MAG: hypothetical protein ACYC2R_05780 [Burkholderiales bacterium]
MSIHEVFVDGGGCFTLPEPARQDLFSLPADELVATPGAKFKLQPELAFIPLNCVLFWTRSEHLDLQRALASLPADVENAPGLRRRLLDMAHLLSPDGQGRLCLPQTLRDIVPLAGAALLRKREGRYELWNPSGFQCRIR